MKWLLLILGSVVMLAIIGALLGNTTPSAKQKAFDSCVSLIRSKLPTVGASEGIKFPRMSSIDHTDGDEFYFAFSSGTIHGATRDKPDVLTKSMEPSASCIGSVSRGEFTWVTVNGVDVVTSPQKF